MAVSRCHSEVSSSDTLDGHAHDLHLAAGGHHLQRLLQRLAAADAVDHVRRTARELIADHERAGGRAHVAGHLVAGAHDVGAELLGEPLLLGVAGGDHDGRRCGPCRGWR